MSFPRLARAAFSACMGLALVVPAAAQEKGTPLKLQLNKTETVGDACQLTFVIDNSRGTAIKTFKVDLFAFDAEGVAQKRVAAELGPFRPNKTAVKMFEFAGITCAKVSRILLNDVLACDGGDAAREACLDRVETESKASITFDR